MTGDTQHYESEHIETSNGNHICIVIQLYTAITIDCCDFSILPKWP